MKITGTTVLFGVLGNPVKHTYSPILQNAAIEKLGLNAAYVPLEVPLDKIELAVKGAFALNFKGINVTIPFKEVVIPYMDKLSQRASTIGSVNTIALKEDGRLMGYNTDGEGFTRALADDLDFECGGKTIIIVGTGGAGKSIAMESAIHQARKIIIAGRSLEKAKILADRVRQFYPGAHPLPIDLKDPKFKTCFKSADLLVNCTSMGMKSSDTLLIEPDWLHPNLSVMDLIYNPAETTLIKVARQVGCPAINGLTMLIWQGAASFKIWLDIMPPVDTMKKAIIDYLALQHQNEGG